MYEVSPERGCESRAGAADAAGALTRELEIPAPAVGDDGAELVVHGVCLSFVDTVHLRVD
ncbi:MAG: hypothetical protein ACRDPM_11290 [Solirubrobacteraceae bacterium]